MADPHQAPLPAPSALSSYFSNVGLSMYPPHRSLQLHFQQEHRILSPDLLIVSGGSMLFLGSNPRYLGFINPSRPQPPQAHLFPNLQYLPPCIQAGVPSHSGRSFSALCSPHPQAFAGCSFPGPDFPQSHTTISALMALLFKCLGLWLAPFTLGIPGDRVYKSVCPPVSRASTFPPEGMLTLPVCV